MIKRQGSRNGHVIWLCKCDCGNYKTILGNSLRTGRTKSCGCLASEISRAYPNRGARIEALKNRMTVHGMTQTKIYYIWGSMKQRCTNPHNVQYGYYGGRGIHVCEEWSNSFQAFFDWAIDAGYYEGLTLDRIDVNGDYSPENCRWATVKEQNCNTRRSIKITIDGETRTLKEWSKIKHMKYTTLIKRYHSGEDMVSVLGGT